jgi:hypothetical protein
VAVEGAGAHAGFLGDLVERGDAGFVQGSASDRQDPVPVLAGIGSDHGISLLNGEFSVTVD